MVNNLKRENDKTYDFYKAFIGFYYICSHLQQALHVCQNKKKNTETCGLSSRENLTAA